LEGSVETLSVREVGNVHIILWQFIQDIANQLLSESFEFCRRYDKTFGLQFHEHGVVALSFRVRSR